MTFAFNPERDNLFICVVQKYFFFFVLISCFELSAGGKDSAKFILLCLVTRLCC